MSSEFDQPFSNPGLINVQMPGKEIQMKSDPAIFKFVRIFLFYRADYG